MFARLYEIFKLLDFDLDFTSIIIVKVSIKRKVRAL